MAPSGDPMPPRGAVDPLFDGHLERPLEMLSASERLDWIWEAMQLLRLAAVRPRARESERSRVLGSEGAVFPGSGC